MSPHFRLLQPRGFGLAYLALAFFLLIGARAAAGPHAAAGARAGPEIELALLLLLGTALYLQWWAPTSFPPTLEHTGRPCILQVARRVRRGEHDPFHAHFEDR